MVVFYGCLTCFLWLVDDAKKIASGYSCSLGFLRWRRLISPLAAVIKKPAVLSPSFLTCSINSKSSSGIRTDTCNDLLFFLPVAISEAPVFRWCSVCTKKKQIQLLTWCSPMYILVVFTLFLFKDKNNETRQCANTNRASNHHR
ncbi:hypothetical protein FFU43_19820 [Salmonella enterica]|nr:hypothetical protein [Salmonella enterica]